MWYLKASGFRVVPLSSILSFMRGDVSGEHLAAITFDDGYRDFYDNAYPILREYNYPSTVFLVSDLIGGENVWDREKVRVRKNLIDWEAILKLKANEVTFGSHSRTHPFLTKLSRMNMIDEIRYSKTFLEDRLQTPVDFFCYPYGKYNEEVIHEVREAGYRAALTTKRGLVRGDDNPFEMHRCLIRNTTHPFLFALRLHTNYEDRRRRTR